MAAAAPWNRANILFPSAVSSVRVDFHETTALHVVVLLLETDKVLQLLKSEFLQTEIRVLYSLLHVLQNSFRAQKPFRALKQVEQCVNRLKEMKLDAALQDLMDLCPRKSQRNVSLHTGECDLPSQPMLEWLCLKVLGASKLLSCSLQRCSRAFILSRRHMKCNDFVLLNVVITSLLSRIWVFFRGILVALSCVYEPLLKLLREVAQTQPMPFLTDFSLPPDIAQFLGHPDACLLTRQPPFRPTKEYQLKQQKKEKKKILRITNRAKRQKREDLGVVIQRDQLFDVGVEPFIKVLGDLKVPKNKSASEETHKTDKKQMFKKKVKAATTFTDMATHLEEMIPWCKSQSLMKEKRLLSFLFLKCKKMKCLEAAGYNVQRKLRRFKQEVCWASSPDGSVPKTCLPIASLWRNTRRRTRLRTRLQSLRTGFRPSTISNCARNKPTERQRKTTKLSESELSEYSRETRASHEAPPQTSDCESLDDIDDIFASVGL